MTDRFAIEEWGSVANYVREMCGADPDDYDPDPFDYSKGYLCRGCPLFDIVAATCAAYPGLPWEMFRRKKVCRKREGTPCP
jgi:hypothetical protein